MSQATIVIPNATFPANRTAINDAYRAITTMQSGSSAPSPSYEHQLWYDTSTNIVKQRNAGNSAWINIARLVGSALVPIGSNVLGYADSSDSCVTTLQNKAIQRGWEARISAAGLDVGVSNTSEILLTSTYVDWATPDGNDSRELDTSVLDWDAVNGRFEVKKAGVVEFGCTVRTLIDSVNNNLTRARHTLRGYGGTQGTGLPGTDTVYLNEPVFDTYLNSEPNDIKTQSAFWQYEKTTTVSTEYVYPAIVLTGTAASGGFANRVQTAQVWCKYLERTED